MHILESSTHSDAKLTIANSAQVLSRRSSIKLIIRPFILPSVMKRPFNNSLRRNLMKMEWSRRH